MCIRGEKIYKKPLFFGWREHLAMYRSGQGLFLPRARVKTNHCHVLLYMTVICMLGSQKGFICKYEE